jgi:apolipoprotein N-acyltransferase
MKLNGSNQNDQSKRNGLFTRKFLVGVGLSVLSGLLLFLSFPPVNIGLLIFVAATPFLIAQYRFFPRKWSALAPTLANLIWLWPFLYRIFDIQGAPFYIQHLGLLIAVFTFFTSTERIFNELTGYRWFILQGLSAWVGFEMIRSFIPFMGTMGFAANPLASQPWVIQPVSIFSIYGLNLLVVLVNFALAQVIMLGIDRRWLFEGIVPVDVNTTHKWALGTGIVVAAWVALSLVIYTRPPETTQTTRVAALQMNLSGPGHQADDSEQAARVELVTKLALEAADKGAEVFYLPEMAFGFDPQEKYTAELRKLAAETDAYIYIPYAYHTGDDWHNETVLLTPSGEFSQIYGKQHAFGEPRTVSAGPNPVNPTPYGVLGSIICMDGVFTDSARQTVSNGAQILAIPTYNATVGISEQNWAHFVLRSAENQVPVINTDRGYYTMITDQTGKILADLRTPRGDSQVVLADVPLGGDNATFYTKFGVEWLGWISLAGFVFFMIFQGVVEKQAKQAKAS